MRTFAVVVAAATTGLSVTVLNYDDRLLLNNDSRTEVMVLDYKKQPMGKNDPPQLKDKSVRTKIDDWTVPIQIGGAPGAAEAW